MAERIVVFSKVFCNYCSLPFESLNDCLDIGFEIQKILHVNKNLIMSHYRNLMFTVHVRPHEIVNNNSPLPINIVGKIDNFCPHMKVLL